MGDRQRAWVQSLFSGYGRVWKGREYGERKEGTEKERKGGGGRGCPFRRRKDRKRKRGDRISACLGRKGGRLEVGGACLLKRQGTQVRGKASIIIIIITVSSWHFPPLPPKNMDGTEEPLRGACFKNGSTSH